MKKTGRETEHEPPRRRMTKAAIPFIKETNGSILFIGSIAGIHGIPNYSAYSCSKMTLTAIVESLQIELSKTGI